MTYILLVAGKGSRLHPLTLNYPKSLYRLDADTTILKRMVQLIRRNDSNAEIVVVLGFQSESIRKELSGLIFVENPFYECTNSIASLWFGKEYLNRDHVVIINGDIVLEERVVSDILCKPSEKPKVCIDSSIKNDGDYNVQVSDERILVMSKDLSHYYGEYAGVTRLERKSAGKLYDCICKMVSNGMYDQWYENALVQMIFNEDFKLYYDDLNGYRWTEVDCVDDMLLARKIHSDEQYFNDFIK